MATEDDDIFDPDMEPEKEDDSRIRAQHKHDINFSLLEVLSVEEFEEHMEYKTWCYKSSSWDVLIKFEKEIPFHNFNMFVTLRRVDLSDFIVEGILVIWLLNIEGKKCPVSYRLECSVDGRGAAYDVFAVDEHYRCLLREDDYLTFPDDVLVVKAQLFVRRCCEIQSKCAISFEKILCCPRL